MSTYAVQFLCKGLVVATEYVTAHSQIHAEVTAARKVGAKWDVVEANKL